MCDKHTPGPGKYEGEAPIALWLAETGEAQDDIMGPEETIVAERFDGPIEITDDEKLAAWNYGWCPDAIREGAEEALLMAGAIVGYQDNGFVSARVYGREQELEAVWTELRAQFETEDTDAER